MATSALVSVEEYLSTDYSPDVDYVDGKLVERNVGEKDHSRLQALLTIYLGSRESEYGIRVFTELRVQISPRRFRVPDLCVTVGPEPNEQILTAPPFLCIEILSPEDRLSRIQDKIDDYLGFGVRYVWLINPQSRRGWIYTLEGIVEARDGVLRTENPNIIVPLSDVLRWPEK
jgi:Uma2 family endonuclease